MSPRLPAAAVLLASALPALASTNRPRPPAPKSADAATAPAQWTVFQNDALRVLLPPGYTVPPPPKDDASWPAGAVELSAPGSKPGDSAPGGAMLTPHGPRPAKEAIGQDALAIGDWADSVPKDYPKKLFFKGGECWYFVAIPPPDNRAVLLAECDAGPRGSVAVSSVLGVSTVPGSVSGPAAEAMDRVTRILTTLEVRPVRPAAPR